VIVLLFCQLATTETTVQKNKYEAAKLILFILSFTCKYYCKEIILSVSMTFLIDTIIT